MFQLVQLTARMAGVDPRLVAQVVQGRQPLRARGSPSAPTSSKHVGYQIQPQTRILHNAARKRAIGIAANNTKMKIYQQGLSRNSIVGSLNNKSTQQPNFSNAMPHRNNNHKAFDLPLEVIIKTEPTECEDDCGNTDFEENSMSFNNTCSTR